MIVRRPRRLDGVSYVGYQRYFLTTCTAFRRPLFTSAALAKMVVEQLLRAGRKHEFAVLAYCVMPDHVHAVVESRSERSDFQAFAKTFKQTTGFLDRQQSREYLWQPGFHERILRKDETTDAAVRYVLENPVCAGLTTALGDYAFAGSGEYTFEELLTAWEGQA